MMRRSGFTFVEILIVIVILGILANLAVPTYRTIRVRAEAAHIVGDFHVVRVAAQSAYAESGTYPPNSGWGSVPRELTSHLPGGFEFSYGSTRYRWRRWALANGLPKNSRQQVLLGFDVQIRDATLMAALRSQYRGEVANISRTSITLVIE